MKPAKPTNTSWGHVADWYKELLASGKGTFQYDIMLPHLSRLLAPKKTEHILDIACGTGFFARAFAEAGASVTGIDIAKELIAVANEYRDKSGVKNLQYLVGSAEDMKAVPSGSFDAATMVMAIQNIADPGKALKEAVRALKPNGRLLIVMNHPAFRVPKHSDWGWDPANSSGEVQTDVQYRWVSRYLSEIKLPIQMHPGDNPDELTMSFHRPLQWYFKMLHKAGFAVSRLEEWESNRPGPQGRRFAASERARKEIPLFLFLEAVKL